MIRRLFAALLDRESPIRRALGPSVAVAAVVLGVQYLQSVADTESQIVVARRGHNEALKRTFDEAHRAYVALHNAIEHPDDAEAQAAVPDSGVLEQLSEALVAPLVDEDQGDTGDVFPATPATAS